MLKYKYSIIIPSFNGCEGLKAIIDKFKNKIFNQNQIIFTNNSDVVFLANKDIYKISKFFKERIKKILNSYL